MHRSSRLLCPRLLVDTLALQSGLTGLAAEPSSSPAPEVLIRDVRVFDGRGRYDGAREMLAHTSLDFGQTAESLGYARTSVFTKAFDR